MNFIATDSPYQIRVQHPTTKMLIGLIHNEPGMTHWRIELFMKIDATAGTKDEAIAFAMGCWAMADAYSIFKKPTPPVIPTISGGPNAPPQRQG